MSECGMSEIPQAAIDAARAALGNLPTGTSLWGYELTTAARAALEAAAPHIRAAERERIAALAEQYGAAYPVTRQDTYGQEYEAGESFADLIREEAPDAS